jgi:hypothetical protein
MLERIWSAPSSAALAFSFSPWPLGGRKENEKAALLAALQMRPPPVLIFLAGVIKADFRKVTNH